ncbi:MAG TPA: 23S rRNA (adenine(2503)-C(2))-methyltransferase RlmN [Candidatus Krumholzibacteria bacterium]|nr:23S rRNA (adenine(2503)-C(2))-methyltransferase RlmN [Candidatus Krumholzibacteria bacterium]HRX51698.1 23S rRNA (adenine(2503)-C(2))-methyltransferase RlmN [Candidatus Krumholzibacteria bacterium]
MRPLLRDLAPAAVADLMTGLGQPAYRADQVRSWLFAHGAVDWEETTNLPRALREALAADHDLAGLAPAERQRSQDGTRKFLFTLRDGDAVESVIIPMENHATFCVSSQVGCAMACSFCATARGGLLRQLTAGEILEQVQRLRRDLEQDPLPGDPTRAFNVVFMGMGEPLDNVEGVFAAIRAMTDEAGLGMSARRITISTSGHAAGLRALAELEVPVGLTLSVNSCDPGLRKKLMPVPGRTPLEESLALAEAHADRIHRPATVAYVLIDGVNDGDAEARSLAELVRHRPFKINLIPMNRIDDRFGPPPADRVLGFQAALADRGVRSTIRISGGEDIDAACGQLRRKRA